MKKIIFTVFFLFIFIATLFGQTLTDFGAIYDYLSTVSGGTSENQPVRLVVSIDLGTMSAEGSGWQNLLSVIGTRGKYIALDLSLCTMRDTEFNPASSHSNGKSRIVSMILPNAAKNISGRFDTYNNLRDISAAEVTAFGTDVFRRHSRLTSVNFPTVTAIGNESFISCSNLTCVSFPAATSIGNSAFQYCSSLLSANFPTAISIDSLAFASCRRLTSTNFPLVTSIGNSAFVGCTSLTNVNFPVVTTIGSEAFSGCTNLTSVNLPVATSIGSSVFNGCNNIRSITISDNCIIQGTDHSIRFLDFKFYYETIRGRQANSYVWNNTAWAIGVEERISEIQIASWWSNYDVRTYQPRTEDEKRQLEYRRRLLADRGLTIREIEIADWDNYFEVVINNLQSRNKQYSVYYLPADWAFRLYRQGLLYPLSDSSVRLNNRVPVAGQRTAYNEMMERMFTFNGKQYVASLGQGGDSWQGNFVFWNKRLFREAGLDPDLPYNLQRDGRWTWDEFRRIAGLLTRGSNFGLPCDDAREVMNAFVYGNNANYVTIDANGRFHNATNSPEFIEAMQFYRTLMTDGVMKPRPANAAWDWDFQDFFNGRVGMLIAAEWRKGQLIEMTDDYGCVLPPKGPKAQNYRMSLTENVFAIPAFFSKEEVDEILTAFDLWNVPVDTNWQQWHYWAFRDRRAVDETMAMSRDVRNITFRNHLLVIGLDIRELIWDLWEFTGDPEQLIREVSPRWNALIDEMNR